MSFMIPAKVIYFFNYITETTGYNLFFLDEGADSQTEGEEMDRARQIRMQEVKLKPLPYLPTDTETEVILS